LLNISNCWLFVTVAGFQNARSVFILLAISQFSFSFARLVVCWIASAVGQSSKSQILVRLAKESQQRLWKRHYALGERHIEYFGVREIC
jgi:hypothetical protein